MADDEEDVDDIDEKIAARSSDLSKRAGVKKQLLDVYKDVEQGFTDQWERSNDQLDYWDIYNTKLTAKQFYSGNSKIFVPIVHNAVNARKTRFTNQIFPQSGRYVEVTSSDGTQPDALTALLEHYVRRAKLRTKVAPALCRSGDIEGQYNVYVSWCERTRNVTWREESEPEIEDTGLANPAAEPVDDIQEEEYVSAYPDVEVLADSDILVLPQTSDTLEEAIDAGGSVTILRRWGKAKINKLIREGVIDKEAGKALIGMMGEQSPPQDVNQKKKHVDSAGIKGDAKIKYALVYETFATLKIRGEHRLCQAFFGGEDNILGCRRNPLWSDKLPLLSVPVEKVAGAFKGQSKVKPCADLQYAANDAVNEAWDSAAYALMPVVMTDPEKNPRVGSMVLSMAAVWETSPKDTNVLQFPQLWQHGFEMVAACKSEVAQTLSVSPAAITAGGHGRLGGEKPTQAEVAQEQQVDILTTADAVTVLEEGILTPMLNIFIELDHQHREKEITVKEYGEMGIRANMETIPPIQFDKRYEFRWFGVEQARSAQMIQQQIAGMNVIRGIPPQQMDGYQINLRPIITQLVENTFGPRLAPLIFVSPEQQMPVPVDQENILLGEGFEVPTHAMDDDMAHIQGHMQAMQQMQAQKEMGGGSGGGANVKKFQVHIWKHMQQGQAKQQAALAAQAGPAAGAPGAPGVPGGAGPGVAGTPRVGAQPAGPRTQGPPGMIHQDQMKDPGMMPRKVVG